MGDHPTSLRDGRYAVIGLLGEGTQAQTLDAVDKKNGRAVAIKRFVVRGARSWKDVELAEREATVLSTLKHPSLPAYYEHFEENGELYLVMEKIEGESLAALRKRGAGLPRAEVLRFLHQIGALLEYLHNRAPPIFHRDIKPGNVIRRPDGSFALVDFGSVRDRLKLEGGSTVVGTFGYMAPEQFQGRALPQTDLYAVGATAICLISGQDPEELPHQGLKIDAERVLGADRELGWLLSQLLEPDPDKRPTALAPLLARLSAHQRARAAEPTLDRPSEALPFPIWLLFVIGLTVARVAVFMALGVLVPALLTLLGVFFGPGLRLGARAVANASVRAEQALERATRVVRGLPIEPPRRAERRRVRVRVDKGGPVVETTAEEVLEEEDAHEHERRA
jgi:serine/threonine protein kinase